MIDKIVYSKDKNEVTIIYTDRQAFKLVSPYDIIKFLNSFLSPHEDTDVDHIETTISLEDTRDLVSLEDIHKLASLDDTLVLAQTEVNYKKGA